MSWLETFRRETDRVNAEIKAAAKKQRRNLRHKKPEYRAKERVRMAIWREKHREEIRKYMSEWRKRTGKKYYSQSAEYQRAWRAAHPGKQAEYDRRHRAKVEAAIADQPQTQNTIGNEKGESHGKVWKD